MLELKTGSRHLKKIHVSLLPKKIGKVPATCLNLFQFQLPELLRQKQALCLIYPCDCLSLAWGTFPCSTIIRKENLRPFLWYFPPNKSIGNVFIERKVCWSKGGSVCQYLLDRSVTSFYYPQTSWLCFATMWFEHCPSPDLIYPKLANRV